jgi:uncharacterized protein YjbI with pentapeptide repeats
LGIEDNFTDVKKHFNKLMLGLYPQLQGMTESSEDPFYTAVCFALTGNYIDFGAIKNIDENKLIEILDKHKKWLNCEEGGERADLSDSDLSGSNLRDSDLREVNLDYSAWPLWCGSLEAYVDDRIAIQLLYHTLSVVQHSPYVSDKLKRALLTPSNIDAANRFHRVKGCGELEVYDNDNTI